MAAPLAPPQAETLDATAAALCARGKGLLAADESTATVGKRLASVGVANTEDNRRALRQLLFTTPDLGASVSGVIMYEETLSQRADDGRPFVEVLRSAGVLPGVKVDTGVQPLPGGAAGESWTAGLDTLAARCAAFYEAGARFAKWRAVLRIDAAAGAPSALALQEAAHGLARYGATCQAAGLVPILEPEVLAEGAHDAEACEAATHAVLTALFAACAAHGVRLEAALLKPNMVTRGDAHPAGRGAPQEVAAATLRVLRRCVPPALPGVLFLSGGQPERVASVNLDAIARAPGAKPWALSFSYGRALQHSALATWRGEAGNVAAAQAVFKRRADANGAAARGQYDAAADADA